MRTFIEKVRQFTDWNQLEQSLFYQIPLINKKVTEFFNETSPKISLNCLFS